MKRRTSRILFAAAVAGHGAAGPRRHRQCRSAVQVGGPVPELPDEPVFSKWLDPMKYTLAPGGSFESAAGLTFTGGAKIVAGNESSLREQPRPTSRRC